jgi:anti-sigma B factor antagonist
VNAPDLPLCVEVQRRDDAAVVVRVAGELDSLTVPAVDTQLTAVQADLVAPAALALVLDLSDLTFMSSAGLALLVTHHEWCAEQGSRLRVVTGNNRSVLRPVRITGLDTVLDLIATVADATGDDR